MNEWKAEVEVGKRGIPNQRSWPYASIGRSNFE